ncbi:MAG: hypothetical protein NXY57DRAFT_968622 [Lentinula lateritia]|nr:MAG: hypothetical protein NXY57DRAFT_968622 [Lentinula lateritia]
MVGCESDGVMYHTNKGVEMAKRTFSRQLDNDNGVGDINVGNKLGITEDSCGLDVEESNVDDMMPEPQNPPAAVPFPVYGNIAPELLPADDNEPRNLSPPELENREREAKDQGKDWAAETAFARICADPWSFATITEVNNILLGYKQAMKDPDLWREPMELEYKMLMEKKVWTLVELPPGANLMGGKWVFAIKRGASGEIL